MSRCAWGTLAVVIAAGGVTTWYSYLLHMHHLPGLPEPGLDPIRIAIAAIPTGVFLAALILRRNSVVLELSVAVAAVLVATLRIYVIRIELSTEWTHGTGLFAAVAWMVGMGVAVGILIVAGVAAMREYAQKQRRSVGHAGSPDKVEPR